MSTQLVVALDTYDPKKAINLAKKLLPATPWMKVGLELFTAAGPEIVKQLKKNGCLVFLDLKFHDIPNTVQGAVRSAIRSGADMCNIHLCGGAAMAMAAATESARAKADGLAFKLLGVTVLTSTQDRTRTGTFTKKVVEYATKAKGWELDGVVCSGHEAAAVKQACGKNFICLCPGIRLQNIPVIKDDQNRVLSPLEAVQAGADFIVVGRPITQSDTPLRIASEIVETIKG